MIKTFSELKKTLKVGDKLTMVSCKSVLDHKMLGKTRAIIKKQTNGVQLEGGSWLGFGMFGEKAADFSFTDDGFIYHTQGFSANYKLTIDK